MDIDEVTERLARAAGEAPTMRADGTILMTFDAQCRVCGCTAEYPCPGGCVWAEPNLCSRCVHGRPRRRG